MAFSWDQITTDLTGSLSRRIDNELNSDFLPSPQQATNETPVVQTADNATGRAKVAGTGGSFVDTVPTSVWIGAGVVGVALVAWLALK